MAADALDAALWGLSMTGAVTSIIQNASGFPLVRRMVKEKNSARFPIAPAITMTVTTVMIGLYGWFHLQRRDGIIVCNVVGFAFWAVNAAVYAFYLPTRARQACFVATYLGFTLFAILLPVLFWVLLPDGAVPERATIVAVIMQSFNIAGFTSPFRSIFVAVRDLDTTPVPRMLSFVNVVNSTLWTAYGALLNDPWVYAPNIAGVAIALVQIGALFYIEHKRRALGIKGVKPLGKEGSDAGQGSGEGVGGGAASTSEADPETRVEAARAKDVGDAASGLEKGASATAAAPPGADASSSEA
jgi:hypothetical protein